jgi:hypothetical protein
MQLSGIGPLGSEIIQNAAALPCDEVQLMHESGGAFGVGRDQSSGRKRALQRFSSGPIHAYQSSRLIS